MRNQTLWGGFSVTQSVKAGGKGHTNFGRCILLVLNLIKKGFPTLNSAFQISAQIVQVRSSAQNQNTLHSKLNFLKKILF